MERCKYSSYVGCNEHTCDNCDVYTVYKKGRADIIEGIRKLEAENYCPVFEMEGMECIHWNDDCHCISCYLDRLEELDKEQKK